MSIRFEKPGPHDTRSDLPDGADSESTPETLDPEGGSEPEPAA